jgi:glycosyltransferase involved in cell wall biosynthesis
MEESLKILLLADGRSVHTVRYQAELRHQGIDVTLASLERGDTVDVQLKKKSVSNSLNYFFSNREIKQLVRKLAPDAVNAHFASGYGFSTALSGVWKKTPVFLHCLGSDILISPAKSIAHKRRVRHALSKASHIFVDSNYLAEKVREIFPVRHIDVIPWGVEGSFLRSFEKRRSRGFAFCSPPKVVVPRPQGKVYNNAFIIESLKDLINNREISLTFLDYGDDLERFKTIVGKHCPNGLIEFYRFKPRDEYIDYISGFDIYLSASLSDSSPVSLIEAMAAGLLPIVGDIPGVREWIDRESGILFDPKESGTLIGAFRQALHPEIDLERILTSNHARVKERAVFAENVKRTIGIFQKVIAHGI